MKYILFSILLFGCSRAHYYTTYVVVGSDTVSIKTKTESDIDVSKAHSTEGKKLSDTSFVIRVIPRKQDTVTITNAVWLQEVK